MVILYVSCLTFILNILYLKLKFVGTKYFIFETEIRRNISETQICQNFVRHASRIIGILSIISDQNLFVRMFLDIYEEIPTNGRNSHSLEIHQNSVKIFIEISDEYWKFIQSEINMFSCSVFFL